MQPWMVLTRSALLSYCFLSANIFLRERSSNLFIKLKSAIEAATPKHSVVGKTFPVWIAALSCWKWIAFAHFSLNDWVHETKSQPTRWQNDQMYDGGTKTTQIFSYVELSHLSYLVIHEILFWLIQMLQPNGFNYSRH